MIKMCALVLMFVEALVVLIRANTHFRVSRALRPIFLIDNHFCGGVRRFIRQILQSLPPIMDMLGLVFFVMLIYR
jgi:two pore calcium channel protein 1